MNEHNESVEETAAKAEQLLEWETPELIVEDVDAITKGGPIGDIDPVDDAFYS